MGKNKINFEVQLIENTYDTKVKPIFAGEMNFSKQASNILEIEPELEKLFNEIYNNFNIENVFENEYIHEILNNINSRKTFDNFIFFCNFLINKIERGNIEKIPQICSNLSNYNGGTKNRKKIKEEINKVMFLYNEKKGKKHINNLF